MSEKGFMSQLVAEHKCPECGRIFCVTNCETWAYRIRNTMYCRYNCMRAAEKRIGKPKEVKAKFADRKLTTAQREGIIRWYIKRGYTNTEIEKETGISAQAANYWRRKMEED